MILYKRTITCHVLLHIDDFSQQKNAAFPIGKCDAFIRQQAAESCLRVSWFTNTNLQILFRYTQLRVKAQHLCPYLIDEEPIMANRNDGAGKMDQRLLHHLNAR